MLIDERFAMIGGAGAMGSALISGLLKNGAIRSDNIVVTGRNRIRLESMTATFGVSASDENNHAVSDASVVFLCVKPFQLRGVAEGLRGKFPASTILVSVLAGVDVQGVIDAFRHERVVRCMPNLPCEIAQGYVPWVPSAALTENDLSRVGAVLQVLGAASRVEKEGYLDSVTPVSGAGPAMVFMFIEALIDAAVHIGLPRPMAEEMVVKTIRGSSELLEQLRVSPAVLRNRVTSPGGVTSECLAELEKCAFRAAIDRAVVAGLHRTTELGAIPSSQPRW